MTRVYRLFTIVMLLLATSVAVWGANTTSEEREHVKDLNVKASIAVGHLNEVAAAKQKELDNSPAKKEYDAIMKQISDETAKLAAKCEKDHQVLGKSTSDPDTYLHCVAPSKEEKAADKK